MLGNYTHEMEKNGRKVPVEQLTHADAPAFGAVPALQAEQAAAPLRGAMAPLGQFLHIFEGSMLAVR